MLIAEYVSEQIHLDQLRYGEDYLGLTPKQSFIRIELNGIQFYSEDAFS